jgi:sec-independent protein translocase protein TatC
MTEKQNTEMSFLDHLEELRWHLIRSVAAIFILAVVAFVYDTFIFDQIILAPKNPQFITNQLFCSMGSYINNPEHKFFYTVSSIMRHPDLCINTKPFQIINTAMAGQFNMNMIVAIVAGLILAFPYVFWEFWRFITPALQTNERKYARWAVLSTSGLFFIGVLFGYYVITPLSIHFLGSYTVSAQVLNQIQLTSYISTILSVTLATGAIFELPVIVFFLSKIGLLTPQFMRKYRRHAIIIILIIAAIITPPDIFSQILVSIPLLILYEVSIFISALVLKKHTVQS